MTDINVRVVGTANVTQMSGAFGKLQSQITSLNAQLAEMVSLQAKGVDPTGYQRMTRAAAQNSKIFRDAAASTGMLNVQQLRVNSATDEYIKKLNTQKLSFRAMAKQAAVATAAYKEQLAMQNMVVRQNEGSAFRGKSMVDVVVPKSYSQELDSVGTRLAFMNAQLKSGATQLINWGKNTQWAGRQLMVGFTMPVAAFGAAAGVMAYKVDQEFTRVKKVYDTTASQVSTKLEDIMSVQQEFTKLQQDSYATATTAAEQYGTKMQDTMSVMADLAATGQKGAALQKATTEVVKNAMLGEIDYQTTTSATIALQQTLHLSTKQLADTWAYMNSVENATSLSMADFAKAIPIALGPLKEMGGTVQTLGTLLTGMVSRGVAVGKAANSIKAAMQRLARPSKQVQEEFAAITGYDINKVQAANKGNLLGMLQDIYQITKNLSQLQKQKVFAGLFGSYQVANMIAMVNSMGDLAKGIGQVSEAQRIGQQSAKQWGDVQRQEIGQMQKSVSGQFKIAVATLQTELVKVGKPFVEVATVAIKFITKIVKAFNGMPDWAKWSVAGAAAFAALAGPIVMLAGLFANLVGNILKFGSSLAGTVLKLEILDKESRVSQMAAKMAGSAFQSEAAAINTVTEALNAMILAQKEASVATREARLADLMSGGMSRGQAIHQLTEERRMMLLSTGQLQGKVMQGPLTKEQAGLAAEQEKSAAKINSNWKGAAGSIALAAGSLALMASSGNKTVDQAATMAMTFGMLAPTLSGLPAVFKRANVGIAGMRGGIAGAARGGLGLLKSFATFAMGPTSLIALAAVGIAGVVMKIKAANSEMQKFNDEAENLGKVFGFQATQIGQAINPKTGQVMDTLISKAKQLKETMPEVTKAIEDAYNSGDRMKALDLARNIGLQVRNRGGTARQARQAVRAALFSAIGDKGVTEKMMVHLNVDFSVDSQVIKASLGEVHNQLQDMINNSGTQSFDEMVFNAAIGKNYKGKAADAAKAAGETFINVFNAQTTEQGRLAVGRMMTEQLKQTDAELLKHYESVAPQIRKIVEQNGITRMSQLDAYTKATQGSSMAAFQGKVNANGSFANDKQRAAIAEYLRYMTGVRLMAEKIAEKTGANVKNLQNIDQIIKALQPNFLTISQAQQKFTEATSQGNKMMDQGLSLVTGQTVEHKKLNDAEKLTILNQLRVRAGLEKTGNLADGFSETVTKKWNPNLNKAKQTTKDISNELAGIKDKNVNINVHFNGKDYVNILQQGMQGLQQNMADQISSNFDSQMNSALNARQSYWDKRQQAQQDAFDAQSKAQDARFEREQNALDAHWQHRKDVAQKYWDAQVKNVQNEIDAEQKADDARQKMFQAEMARISALNDAQNRNIDFNVALSSGKLDEAAKIRNDAQAAQAQTALQRAADAGAARSQARIDRLGKRQDRVQARADAYMKKLDKQEQKAQAALKKREDAERAHLAKMQKMRSQALKNEADANMKALQDEWDARKKSLDMQLALFTSYIARNKADLKQHMKDVGLSYKAFGDNILKPMGLTWAQYFRTQLRENIHKAGLEIASDKMWSKMGASAAKAVLDSFGFDNMADFKNFIKTGNMPTKRHDRGNGVAGSPGVRRAGSGPSGNTLAQRHGGGWVEGGKDSRVGVASQTSGIHPSERLLLARKKEFVVNEHAAARNADVLERINRGEEIGKNGVMGGASPGMAGMMSAIMTKMLIQGITTALSNKYSMKLAEVQSAMGQFGTAKAGKYGQISFSKEQLRNASIIANVGKQMGMSKRDVEIGIMTAITESGLRNLHYGDRDSQGLFQQRPSAGWGTVQQVTNPEYAAHAFFQHLKGIGNRGSMSPWMAAQSVQRSAYSDGSNYRQYWDEAIAIINAMNRRGSSSGAYVPGAGGRHRPINVPVTSGIHDQYTGYPAVDFSARTGTPIYAVADGRISRSYDIRGYEPRRAGYGKAQDGFKSYGRVMYLKTDSGPEVLYAHLSRRGLPAGARVRGGSIIGKSGDTGNSTGPHLHFGSRGVSPLAWMKDGGHTLNQGLAMLHPSETVLTKPLSADLESVVSLLGSTARNISSNRGNVASGTHNVYNLKVILNGSEVSADEVAEKTMTLIKKAERRKPRSRRG